MKSRWPQPAPVRPCVALEQFQESLKISQRLAVADARSFQAQTDLALGHVKVAFAQEQAFRHAEAAGSFEKALALLRPWQQGGKLKGTRFANMVGDFENEVRLCQACLKALGDLDGLLKQPLKERADLLAAPLRNR